MTATGTAKTITTAVRINPTSSAEIEWTSQQLQIGIARRAYELFQLRGEEHGHDWEDWFRAESEMLRPVSVAISESNHRVSIRVNVLGFEPGELKISVEPWRVTLLGAKRQSAISAESEYPDQAFRIIALPAEVNPSASAIVFESGVLKLELFKVARTNSKVSRQSA